MENTTTPGAPKQPRFVRWALLVGIVVILNIFFWRLTATIFPDPVYTNYCADAVNAPAAQVNAAACQAAGGDWTDTSIYNTNKAAPQGPEGYCSCSKANMDALQKAQEQHDLYAFIAMIGLGIVSLILGLMPMGSSIVSSGLSYGGVVTLILGAGRYWSSASQWIQLLIAAVGLVLLVYVGLKRFRD